VRLRFDVYARVGHTLCGCRTLISCVLGTSESVHISVFVATTLAESSLLGLVIVAKCCFRFRLVARGDNPACLRRVRAS